MNASPRTIVVTGVTRGIGQALARALAADGHTVHGCGRSAAALDALRNELGATHSFTSLDISNAESVDNWARTVLASGDAPDLVVNNAAIINQPAPLWSVPADEFERVIATNVNGTAHVIRAFVPAMIDAGRGVIVNMSSGWGRSTSPDVGPYCASKFAVEALSASLAQELPRGLASVAMSPGVVDTDMLRTCLPDTAAVTDGPSAWAERNTAFFLGLDASHNGQSMTAN